MANSGNASQDRVDASKAESTTRSNTIARNGSGRISAQSLTKFEDFDKNKDGTIAKDEVPANDQLAVNFSSYDKDSDSKISQSEFAQYKNGGGNRQLASAKQQTKAKAKAESQPEQQ